MKHIKIIVVGLIIIITGAVVWWRFTQSAPTDPNYNPITTDYRVVDNGFELIGQGTPTYFGNEARADLNHDGHDDIAFLFTVDKGGTGTFFYVVVALSTRGGYEHTNAIFLGDRIAPQTTEIHDEQIVVNYADRKLDEPMTTPPTVAVSWQFRIVGTTLVSDWSKE